jgi:apolipoprotein D and lipocalin family protein
MMTNQIRSQTKVTHVDLQKYSGKWYVIASIPTKFDKEWTYVTESYTVNQKGNVDIFTTYKKDNAIIEKSFKSKGFPIATSNNMQWKVQIIWPFKANYLVEELADDYTHVVVGHPKQKFLYIMNRTGKMGNIQYEEIVKRMMDKGYDISLLNKIDQGFKP